MVADARTKSGWMRDYECKPMLDLSVDAGYWSLDENIQNKHVEKLIGAIGLPVKIKSICTLYIIINN